MPKRTVERSVPKQVKLRTQQIPRAVPGQKRSPLSQLVRAEKCRTMRARAGLKEHPQPQIEIGCALTLTTLDVRLYSVRQSRGTMCKTEKAHVCWLKNMVSG